MTKHRRFNWFLVIRLAGIALFIFVLSRTDLGELWVWLKQISGRMILLALLFQVLLLFFKCWRWFMLNETRFERKMIYQRFGEFLEAYAIGVVTPGRMGEILKAGHAKGRTGVASAALLVLSERGLDLSIFFFMAGIVPVLGYLPAIRPEIGYLFIFIALAGIILSFSILLYPVVSKILERILKLLNIVSKDQSLTFAARKISNLTIFTILSLVGNLCAFLSFYYTALAVLIKLDFLTITGSVALAGVINTIPVTIMGLGTRDITLIYVLQDIPQAQVLAFSGMILIVSQVGGGVIALLTGQYFLLKAKKTNRDNLH
jgi:uncharacterized protein (TIRG00374 family)